jgi:PKD repeat protein
MSYTKKTTEYLNTMLQLMPSGNIAIVDEPENISVDFDFEATSDTEVNFTSDVTGIVAEAYDWDFGDGSAHSSEANPTHDYEV